MTHRNNSQQRNRQQKTTMTLVVKERFLFGSVIQYGDMNPFCHVLITAINPRDARKPSQIQTCPPVISNPIYTYYWVPRCVFYTIKTILYPVVNQSSTPKRQKSSRCETYWSGTIRQFTASSYKCSLQYINVCLVYLECSIRYKRDKMSSISVYRWML